MDLFTVEQVEEFKNVDDSLLEFVEDELFDKCSSNDESNNVKDLIFEYNDVKYYFKEIEQDEWIDDGKYQSSCIYYQLVNKKGDKFNLIVILPIMRSGSYFSDYYYSYYSPEVKQLAIIQVPEKIIPAHEEVVMK